MLRILVLLTILMAACPARAGNFTCPEPAKPEIAVSVDIATPRFDFSLDRAALNQKFAGIPLPSPDIYHLEINSVMTGPLTANHTARLTQRIHPGSARACVGFDRIAVTLEMRPVIYIASEFRRRECEYKAFLEHELKHVAMDRDILDDYAARMKDGLMFAFAENRDRMIGPIPASLAAEARKALQDHIQGSIENLLRMTVQGRMDRQREIDTYYEYARLSNAC